MIPKRRILVEPPGTAPGSDPLITSAFMSIVPKDALDIGKEKGKRNRGVVTCWGECDPFFGRSPPFLWGGFPPRTRG